MSDRTNHLVAKLPDPGELRIGIIILTFNQREQTLLCLEHLENQECKGELSILVWDNGSQDDTGDAIMQKFPGDLCQPFSVLTNPYHKLQPLGVTDRFLQYRMHFL